MITSLAAWLRRLLHHLSSGFTVVITWCRGAWEPIAERHRERLISEPGYRSTLSAGIAAVIGTVTAQPAIAASLAVLVAEHLRVPNSGHHRGGRRIWDAFDEDDDDPDTLTSPRSWAHRR